MENITRELVLVDEMQFGFVSGRGTTDVVLILRQLQEKHVTKENNLFFAIVDLEKAFDHVPVVGTATSWHTSSWLTQFRLCAMYTVHLCFN